MIIDLSLPIQEGLAVPEKHPPVERVAIDTHEANGKSNTRLSFSIHASGTHVDAPWHIVPSAATIDEVPLDQLMGEGVHLDCRAKAEKEPILPEDLQKEVEEKGLDLAGKIALIDTGWSDRWYHSDHFYGHGPYLSLEAARWLVSRKIKAVGVDMPPGKADVGGGGASQYAPGGSLDVHRAFLSNNVPIVENLVGLNRLPATGFTVIAFPVKVHRGDGAPARVVALVEG